MEREQIIKALERCLTLGHGVACKGCPLSYKDEQRMDCLETLMRSTLAIIAELAEENERLEDNLIKQSTENIMLLIEQQEIKANTVRRMQSDIQEACLKGGIWPAFVAGVVKGVGDKILEENNVQVTD